MSILGNYGGLAGGLISKYVCTPITYLPPKTKEWGGGQVSTEPVSTNGFVSTVSEKLISTGVVQSGDVTILIPLTEMAEKPKKDGLITDENGSYVIMVISKDPISAMWKLYARPKA